MSTDFTLTNAYIKTYSENIRILVQQMQNKFRDKVMIHHIVGQKYYVDYIGTSEPVAIAGSTADTIYTTAQHSRRRIMARPYQDGKIVDPSDVARMGTDPTNPYMQTMKAGFERKMDSLLMAAAIGVATTVTGDDEAESTVALPVGQIISESGTIGMTASKIKNILKIFNLNDVDQDEPKFLALSPYGIDDLLSEPDMSLADREALNIIRTGQIKQAFGFTCLLTNRLPAAVANIRTSVAWVRAGLTLGIQEDVKSRISELPNKNYAIGMYMKMDIGATRMEEKLVVACQAYES